MEEKPKNRIGNVAAIILIALAGVADLVTLIPFAGSFLGWIFWLIMTLVFWKMGLGLVNWRRLVPGIISAAAEIIPVVQEFPTIIAAMISIIVLSRIEDKLHLKILPSKTKPGVTMPRLNRAPPRYVNGVGRTLQENETTPRAPGGGLPFQG